MKRSEIIKAVQTRFELYSAAQSRLNSRLPRFTKKDWKKYADESGMAIVLYYSDGSIGLKKQ